MQIGTARTLPVCLQPSLWWRTALVRGNIYIYVYNIRDEYIYTPSIFSLLSDSTSYSRLPASKPEFTKCTSACILSKGPWSGNGGGWERERKWKRERGGEGGKGQNEGGIEVERERMGGGLR
jgi:hypothetical protein